MSLKRYEMRPELLLMTSNWRRRGRPVVRWELHSSRGSRRRTRQHRPQWRG